MDGYTRNFVDIRLPRGIVAYAYRISLYKIDGVKMPDRLIELLSAVPIAELKAGLDISKYVVTNPIKGGEVDYFIFTKASEADHFFNKEDEIWKGCKSFLNSASTCVLSDECLGSQFFFGFRNNSGAKGLDVNLELVAIVDEDQALINQSMSAYEIKNSLTADMAFQLSTDGKNWTDYTVPTGSSGTYNYNESTIYFKINNAGGTPPTQYKINTTQKYKIYYNDTKKRLDLMGYK